MSSALQQPELEAAQIADLEAIIAKAKGGVPLTDSEYRRLRDAAEGGDADAAVGLSGVERVWAPNQVVLAEELGVDRKTINRWSKLEGCPGASADGRYNVPAWDRWRQERGLKKSSASARLTEKEKLELAEKRERIEKMRISNDLARGRACDLDEVVKTLTPLLGAMATMVQTASHSLAPQVVGMSVPDATRQIQDSLREAMAELSLGAWAKKKPFWSTVSAMLSDLLERHGVGSGPNGTSSTP